MLRFLGERLSDLSSANSLSSWDDVLSILAETVRLKNCALRDKNEDARGSASGSPSAFSICSLMCTRARESCRNAQAS